MRNFTNMFIRKCPLIGIFLALFLQSTGQPASKHNLVFDSLSTSWDEGIPLGNAILGALIWEKNNRLRFSLDRADLWDLRPMKGLHGPHFSYGWIREQVLKGDYKPVQQKFDVPYEAEPAPSKIPGAALEINIDDWGPVESAELHIADAVSEIRWKNGIVLQSFVHASKPVGWIRIVNLHNAFEPEIVPPAYESGTSIGGGSVEGDDLNRLGYKQGRVAKSQNNITYTQTGWNGFQYQVSVSYRRKDSLVDIAWSITSHKPSAISGRKNDAALIVQESFKRTFDTDLAIHTGWWTTFWSKSSLSVPDAHLEKQWYLEQYKFGSAARAKSPPISLQAIWTADNGRLPPWKGDYHHDLNTQLSYWPSYSSNHLEEGAGYYNHLDANKKNYKRYTKSFFGVDGLNVPGVTTLNGTEMGGWIQYSGSPTISAWLAHNYYMQWKYSMDDGFLKESAYPWIKETAIFLENITYKDSSGLRVLPLSSSPEIYNNSIDAWFLQNTNYDLALMKFVFTAASEMALELGKKSEAARWKGVLDELGDYALSVNQELMFAPGKPYNESHRHFSNVMAIHPLSLIKWEDGEQERSIIRNTVKALDSIGPGWWCGYSYSWLANIKARMKDGEGAREALDVFARAFCLKNSFHVNGDQTASGLSGFTYRPFTLEGNFAFAAGLQEMLMQSYAGFIDIFPAVPSEWRDISFTNLRAEGAFLVDARKEKGELKHVKITSLKGGTTRLKLPTGALQVAEKKGTRVSPSDDNFTLLEFDRGGVVAFDLR